MPAAGMITLNILLYLLQVYFEQKIFYFNILNFTPFPESTTIVTFMKNCVSFWASLLK